MRVIARNAIGGGALQSNDAHRVRSNGADRHMCTVAGPRPLSFCSDITRRRAMRHRKGEHQKQGHARFDTPPSIARASRRHPDPTATTVRLHTAPEACHRALNKLIAYRGASAERRPKYG